jgi:hypothetical protein
MRTDGRTDMTKLTVAFRNSANAPKNCYISEVGRPRDKEGRGFHEVPQQAAHSYKAVDKINNAVCVNL